MKKQRMQKRTKQKSILDYQLEALAYRFVIDTMLSMNAVGNNIEITHKICQSAFHVVTIMSNANSPDDLANDEHCIYFGGMVQLWANGVKETKTLQKEAGTVIWLAAQMIQQLTISGVFPFYVKVKSDG